MKTIDVIDEAILGILLDANIVLWFLLHDVHGDSSFAPQKDAELARLSSTDEERMDIYTNPMIQVQGSGLELQSKIRHRRSWCSRTGE